MMTNNHKLSPEEFKNQVLDILNKDFERVEMTMEDVEQLRRNSIYYFWKFAFDILEEEREKRENKINDTKTN